MNTEELVELISEGMLHVTSRNSDKTTDENKRVETVGYMLKEHGLIPLNKTSSGGLTFSLTERKDGHPGLNEAKRIRVTPTRKTYTLLHSRLSSPGHNALITSPLKSATKGPSIPSTLTTFDC